MATEATALLEKLDRISEVEAAQKEPLPRPFGPYVLLTSLAKGGMGEVFLAKSGAVAGFEKHCVVKTLRPHLTDDREYVARFIDEARVVVQLNHKSVCQVFDVGMVGERYYLAMELIAGKDVRTLADVGAGSAVPAAGATMSVELSGPTVRPFDPALAIHITGEVLEALDYAHRFVDVGGTPLHLVHRDVSPQNVMLSFEGEVKLIDFGLAASTVKMEQTSPNVVMGKLAYMAPEQIRGEKVDGRADMFATAVMLAELCTGERYYAGKTAYEIWSIASSGTFRPRRFQSIEAGLRKILDRALSPEPADRPASCLALRQDLMEWRQKAGLYADGPMLRGVMQTAFAADIREYRELLAGASMANMRPTARVKEPTRSFARAGGTDADTVTPDTKTMPSSSSSSSSTSAPSEHTRALVRDLHERRRRPVFLGVAAGVGIAAVLFGVPQLLSPDDDDVSVAVAPVVAPVVEPVEPVLSGTPGVEAVVVPAPPVVDLVVPVVDDKPEPRARTPKAKTPEKPPEKPPERARTSSPSKAAWSEMGIPERVKSLGRTCKLACVDDVQRRFPSWGSGSGAEMKQFRNDVDACHDKCK
ncbi:MAG: serine/threonine-protein kinase [Deltaproteobacteria bacterium]|nr:serine/threonine-protein kinase [Deltaproteobacteria bacterium]